MHFRSSPAARFDVIVVGAGGSGLAAALSAAQEGANVLVLEKRPVVGGTTALAVGSLTASRTDLQRRSGVADSPQDHYEDLGRIGGGKPDNRGLRQVLVDQAGATVDWLEGLGVTFFGPMPEAPHRRPRMHNVLPSAEALVRQLRRHCLRAGVKFQLNSRVVDLIHLDARVVGVEVEVEGNRTAIRARRAVILASGDFSASEELIARFLPARAQATAINPHSTGDGHRLGLAAGSEIINADECLGPHLRFVPPARRSVATRVPDKVLARAMHLALKHAPVWLLRPFLLAHITTFLAPSPRLFEAGALLVNARGERLTGAPSSLAEVVAQEVDSAAFIVLDDNLARAFERWPNYISTAPGVAYAYLADYHRNRRDIFRQASTIPELARAIGADAQSLKAAIQQGGLGHGPWRALGPVKAWLVVTDGGLKVDEQHRVLTTTGRPIEGLYAAGSVGQGGLQLGGHGHRLAWAFTSGRRAGSFAVRRPTATGLPEQAA